MRAVSAAVGFLLFAPVAIASAAPFAGDVEIGGGRSLYMECRGSGAPTVILEAGLRTRGDVWSAKLVPGQPVSVFGRLSKLTRVCEYDRPGTITFDRALGRSDPVAMPRTEQRLQVGDRVRGRAGHRDGVAAAQRAVERDRSRPVVLADPGQLGNPAEH